MHPVSITQVLDTMHLATKRQKNISMEVKDGVDHFKALIDSLKACKCTCNLALFSLLTLGYVATPNADLQAN